MANENINVEAILPILRKIPLFSNLDETMHREIIQHIVLMYYPANYVIFNEGDAGDALYIMKKGRVEVFHKPKEEGDLGKKVSEIGADGFFGEMALVSDIPRNASVRTLEDTEVFILNKEDFKQLLSTNTAMAEQISSAVVSRMKDNDKQ
ncbi:cyclic nucleotide-binding domain-containing protein [Candidatus Peregrinibacteria bacterium]|nr:cyclic nucleotide-binding domain-containing protein [Candidatus Peregrinibacteria bacterium]